MVSFRATCPECWRLGGAMNLRDPFPGSPKVPLWCCLPCRALFYEPYPGLLCRVVAREPDLGGLTPHERACFLDFLKFLARPPEYSVYWVGSRAWGYARPDSDYDIGIIGPRTNLPAIVEVRQLALEQQVGKKIDLVYVRRNGEWLNNVLAIAVQSGFPFTAR